MLDHQLFVNQSQIIICTWALQPDPSGPNWRQMSTFSKAAVTSVEHRFVRTVRLARPPLSRGELRRFPSKAMSINLLPQKSPLFWEDFRADWRTLAAGGILTHSAAEAAAQSSSCRLWAFLSSNPRLSWVRRERLRCSATDWAQNAPACSSRPRILQSKMNFVWILVKQHQTRRGSKIEGEGAARSCYRELRAVPPWFGSGTPFCQNLHFKRPSPPLLIAGGCERVCSHICITMRVCKIRAKSTRELLRVDSATESQRGSVTVDEGRFIIAESSICTCGLMSCFFSRAA